MIKLSTGEDSTLESYIKMSKGVFGADSPATKFLEEKAAGATHGVKEEVIAPESQVVMLLMGLHAKETDKE